VVKISVLCEVPPFSDPVTIIGATLYFQKDHTHITHTPYWSTCTTDIRLPGEPRRTGLTNGSWKNVCSWNSAVTACVCLSALRKPV